MRVLMLGWEFPPFISGGLGTACHGLTKALGKCGVDITFVLPKAIDSELTSHVNLLAPQTTPTGNPPGKRSAEEVAATFTYEQLAYDEPSTEDFSHVTFQAIPAKVPAPYQQSKPAASSSFFAPPTEMAKQYDQRHTSHKAGPAIRTSPRPGFSSDQATPTSHPVAHEPGSEVEYDGDLYAAAKRYAALTLDLCRNNHDFDVVHAHDWLTFPAGIAASQALSLPLVVHIHSTEFDRAGDNINQAIYAIEKQGLHAATAIIAVSHLTKSIVCNRYDIPPEKVHVVYNGIDNGVITPIQAARPRTIDRNDKIALFLGRITHQKGPEYFVEAAKKVLEKIDNIKFIMAGSGDKTREVIELAAKHGIGNKVLFTGFLRGNDVQRVFQMADVYVMPSVSEPFGIAALEAIRQDVPVIVSKTSGVAEVVRHALKVDFWDTHAIADRIVNVLTRPPLAAELRKHADLELRKLTWDGAAIKTTELYTQLTPTALHS
ncbi:Glycogen synthase [Poriferisphaera corsica]|uniref:starch synthase n=1 Tax=Poriferisphaera corsica TaxID=2528020 RepID=A0A517YQ58_9BACT|nr:glycosyltransferase [Poriferisphaera corsica]QDU32358.1 Glycogen synthase [Poriferisphaera corsica]